MGGAVNTILLRTRDTTHDVDFISPMVTADQMHLLSQASSAAMEEAETSLGEQWINNQTSLFVPAQLQNELVQDARVQNEIVFQEPGLTVLAVPWKYALCAKLERMGKSTRRSYDVDDAVAYLDRHIHVHGGNVVLFKDLENWGIHYHTAVTRPLAQEVAERYRQIHGSEGIAFD
ncbi:MAG: hypothetical protein L6R35_003603 [Caloplaca aegaea]|nr:MAG: hypothetical protein L6R35_003603 [Caloplaca aegaea]